MKVLLIEDDLPIASIIRLGLKGARYTVDVAADGCEGERMALAGEYQLIILDVMLPGKDGWDVCGALREAGDTTPILMLTALDAPEDRVRGLELGADDYLPKPFHFPELLARVHALVRRGEMRRGRVVRVADLEIDTQAGRAARGGRALLLTQGEYALLEALAVNEGRLLSSRSLQGTLAGPEPGGLERVAANMESLRRKIDGDQEPKLICAVGDVGFLMRTPEPAAVTASR